MRGKRRHRKVGKEPRERVGRRENTTSDSSSMNKLWDVMSVAAQIIRAGTVLEQHDALARTTRAVANMVKAIWDLLGN